MRAIKVGPVAPVHYENLARSQISLGKLDSAEATLDRCTQQFPRNVQCPGFRILFEWMRGRYDSMGVQMARLDSRLTEPSIRSQVALFRADYARLRGRIREADQLTARANELATQSGARGEILWRALNDALDAAWFFGDSARALRLLDDALAREPISRISMTEAPYVGFVDAYALAGRPDRARALLAEWETRRQTAPSIRDSTRAHEMRGFIALFTAQYAQAQTELRAADQIGCRICNAPMLARAYDLDGKPDSAIVVYERFLSTPYLDRTQVDGAFVPAVHKRLGELYEARGQRDKALAHYRAFIELWKDADPELQPKVTDARQRMALLTKGRDR